MQTDNVGAGMGFLQQMRGDRRVDPSRHGHDDSLAIRSVIQNSAGRGEHPPPQGGGGRHLGRAGVKNSVVGKVKVAVVPLICSRWRGRLADANAKTQRWHNAAAAASFLPFRLDNRQRKQPWGRYYRTSRRTCPKASAAVRRGS